MKLHLALAFFACSFAAARDFVTANDQARFLAGLPVDSDSPLAPFTKSAAWQQHAAEMDQAWAQCENRSLAKTRAWAGKFVKSNGSSAPCYYMFSGPDILYAHTIYPNASTYVLCGIETIGSVAGGTKIGENQATLPTIRRAVSNVLRFSYFITKDMRADIDGSLGGVTPILYFFLARMGCDIVSVENVSHGAPGVRIVFRDGMRSQQLYYFRADLSNGASGTAVMNFCRRQGAGGLGLLKAASYLLHEGSFSQCRDFLLTNCRVLVQDDSGIPHRHLAGRGWQVRYFGSYTGTTGGPFAKYFQPDLAQAYQTVSPVEIDFQLSYQWNVKLANLQVGVRTSAPPPAATPAPAKVQKVTKTKTKATPAPVKKRKLGLFRL